MATQVFEGDSPDIDMGQENIPPPVAAAAAAAPAPAAAAAPAGLTVKQQQVRDQVRKFVGRVNVVLPGIYDELQKAVIISLKPGDDREIVFKLHDYIEAIIADLKRIQPMRLGGKRKKTRKVRR
jgi:hypothetical protein